MGKGQAPLGRVPGKKRAAQPGDRAHTLAPLRVAVQLQLQRRRWTSIHPSSMGSPEGMFLKWGSMKVWSLGPNVEATHRHLDSPNSSLVVVSTRSIEFPRSALDSIVTDTRDLPGLDAGEAVASGLALLCLTEGSAGRLWSRPANRGWLKHVLHVFGAHTPQRQLT
jgi:hypothetical protein